MYIQCQNVCWVRRQATYAFLKKLAMLPWPFLLAGLPFVAAAGFGAGFARFGSGSSSENDSHTASSFVTASC